MADISLSLEGEGIFNMVKFIEDFPDAVFNFDGGAYVIFNNALKNEEYPNVPSEETYTLQSLKRVIDRNPVVKKGITAELLNAVEMATEHISQYENLRAEYIKKEYELVTKYAEVLKKYYDTTSEELYE